MRIIKAGHDLWQNKFQMWVRRILLKIVKNDKLYFIVVMFSVVFIMIASKFILGKNAREVLDITVFTTLLLEMLLVMAARYIRIVILNSVEDPNKLTTNYQKLIECYSAEKNFMKTDSLSDNEKMPVIHVAWLYDKEIEIHDHPENEYQLPGIIENHYLELLTAHETSKIYNSIMIRVDDWNAEKTEGKFLIYSGRTTYYNSLVTNRAMDYELQEGISIRKLLECGPIIKPVRYSLLSNHLGFNGFVESADGEIMLVFRNKYVSIGKKTYGNSVGASLKSKYALNDENCFTCEGMENAIVLEIEDELGIHRDELQQDSRGNLGLIHLIAAYRDVVEGGKPQLLFYVKATIGKKELEERFYNNAGKTKAVWKRSKESNEKVMKTDGNKLYWIPREKILECKIYADRIEYNGMKLQMVPSAAACFAMIRSYFAETDKGTKNFCCHRSADQL